MIKNVCFKKFNESRYRLEQLDNHFEIDISCNQVFLNPCHKHYICGYCIRQSLKSNPENILKNTKVTQFAKTI